VTHVRRIAVEGFYLVHPTAIIGDPPEHREWHDDLVPLAPEIGANVRINSFVTVDAGLHEPTRIGARTFLMTKTHVGHDAQVGADCELAPGTVVGGHAVLGDGVRCGIGVLVLPGKKVGARARLGAGAVVTKDVPPGEVWVGNPAAPLRKGPTQFETWKKARARR
jgi:UDP-N-acetylglucosamine acyltransferase